MIVEAGEVGRRPQLLTKARAFAPQALQAIIVLLTEADWADKAFAFIDWTNETKQQPDEVAYPILVVQVVKACPDLEATLRTEARFDIDDIFGQDSMTANLLVDLLQDIRKQQDENIAKRRAQR